MPDSQDGRMTGRDTDAVRHLQYRQALNEALHEEMERDPTVFMIGEDIGSYGGPFKITEGLYERFGEKRVRDAPISEAGFSCCSAGLGTPSPM